MSISPLYLLDASVFFFKAYFLDSAYYEDDKGRDISAVVQFAKVLIKLLKNDQPVFIAAAFDESLFSGFRHELSDSYKANRALPDESLSYQMQLSRRLVEALGIKTFAGEKYEADDYIASLAEYRELRQPLIVLSNDKDLGQLLRFDGDLLFDYSKHIRLTKLDIEKKFGVRSSQISDYLALAGDSVDGITGVPGVGAKTAQKILKHFDSVELLLEAIEDVLTLDIRAKETVYQAIEANKEQLVIDQMLTSLAKDIHLGIVSNNDLKKTKVDLEFFRPQHFSMLEKYLVGL